MKQQEKQKLEEARRPASILVVEDEPNMVAGLRDNFEFEGYRVITASDGVEGLRRALEESPDLVILDVMMPQMSGLEVCRQLRAKRASIPIIMLTARGQEVDKVVGLELGADDSSTHRRHSKGSGSTLLWGSGSGSPPMQGGEVRQAHRYLQQRVRVVEVFRMPLRRDAQS
jgi:CheY-like chemotaxis protein